MQPKTERKYKKAMALIAEGKRTPIACKMAKIPESYFYKLRRTQSIKLPAVVTPKRTGQLVKIHVPEERPGSMKVFIMQGSELAVRDLARALGGMFGGENG